MTKKKVSTGEWIYFIISAILGVIILVMTYTNTTLDFLNNVTGLSISPQFAVLTSFIVGSLLMANFLIILIKILFKYKII